MSTEAYLAFPVYMYIYYIYMAGDKKVSPSHLSPSPLFPFTSLHFTNNDGLHDVSIDDWLTRPHLA